MFKVRDNRMFKITVNFITVSKLNTVTVEHIVFSSHEKKLVNYLQKKCKMEVLSCTELECTAKVAKWF